jgi:hypothetical protein
LGSPWWSPDELGTISVDTPDEPIYTRAHLSCLAADAGGEETHALKGASAQPPPAR